MPYQPIDVEKLDLSSVEDDSAISATLGFFLQSLHGQLPESTLKEFENIEDGEKMVEFALKLDELHSSLDLIVDFDGKDAKKSVEFRNEGNKYFKKKQNLLALDRYNTSIMLAPWREQDKMNVKKGEGLSDSENGTSETQESTESSGEVERNELVLALANRSAVLLHLKKYNWCLWDVAYALDHGYPLEMKYKLYDRIGKCLYKQKQKVSAIDNFKTALKLIQVSKLNDQGKGLWTKSITKQIEECEALPDDFPPAQKPTDGQHLPILAVGPNTTHPAATNMVDFECDKILGRNMRANQNICVGKVLMVEEPYVHVLYSDFYTSNCYHCLRRAHVPLPCPQCITVRFCSKECQKEAWDKYHQVECREQGYLAKGWCGRVGHLTHRIATQMGYSVLMGKLKQLSQEEGPAIENSGFDEADGTYSNDSNALFNLTTHMNDRDVNTRFEFTIMACFLTKVLQMGGFFPKDSGVEEKTKCHPDLVQVGNFMMKMLMINQCNSLGITEIQNPDNFEKSDVKDIGAGIYCTASLVNHSCDPNASLEFYDSRLVLRAVKNIREGEPVYINYGPVFHDLIRHKRMQQLKQKYSFTCECRACKNNWPVWKALESQYPHFICTECRELHKLEEIIDEKLAVCAECGHRDDLPGAISQLEQSHENFHVGMQYAMNGNFDKGLPMLETHFAIMERHISNPWKDLTACGASILHVYRLRGNKRQDFPA